MTTTILLPVSSARRLISTFMTLAILMVGIAGGLANSIASPDGMVAVTVDASGGSLTYSVNYQGATIIETSPLGLTANGTNLGTGVTITGAMIYSTNETFASRSGIHATATNRFQAQSIAINHAASGLGYFLNLRVFNNGVAFRYEFTNAATKNITAESSSFILPTGSMVWADTNTSNYEKRYVPMDIAAWPTNIGFGPPVTIQLPGSNGFMALTESALGVFGNSFIIKVADTTGRKLQVGYPANQGGSTGASVAGTVNTPWNVIMIGADLNLIINNDEVESLSPPPDPGLFPQGTATNWATQGRSVWDWLEQQPGGITASNAMINSLWASRMGYEYNTIDEGWANWTNASGTVDPWPLVQQVTSYSHALGVKVLIWKRSSELNTQAQRTTFFQQLKTNGADGFKADFFDYSSVNCAAKERVKLQEDILREAVPYHLVANFHGCAKPTGQFRTYPNLLNFEAVFGKEQWPNAWMIVSIPFMRFMAGPADYTPLAFRDNDAFEIATVINMPAPLITFASRSDAMAKSSFASLIRAIPGQWDETTVLSVSKLGETTATARRKGTEWFIGVMTATVTTNWTVPLTFLAPNVTYQADIIRQDSTVLERTTVTRNSTFSIAITTTGGSGFVARLYPVTTHSTNDLLSGTIIGTSGSWGGSGNTISKVFDGNLTTYFDGPDANGQWAGLDLGSGIQKRVTAIRHCPRAGWAPRMLLGLFQGANTADFSDAVTLATSGYVPVDGSFTTVLITNTAMFRYLRYLSPDGGQGNVAEVQFYGTGKPVAPAGLQAAAGLGQAVLNWNPVPGATSYRLKWSLTGGGPYSPIAQGLTGLSFTNTGLSNGTNYYYVVSATNAAGESADTAEVVVKPGGYEAWLRTYQPWGYWRLNETADTVAADASTNGRTGVYQPMVTLALPGVSNPPGVGFEAGKLAAGFNGHVNSWVSLPGLNLNSATATFTAWIYPTNATQPGATGLVFCRDGAGTTSGVGYNPAGTQLGYTWNNDGATYGWNSGLAPPVNQWSLVSLVLTPTNATLYLANANGQISASFTHAHAMSTFSGETRIGNDAYDASRTFKGRLCEVAVFKQALKANQITTLYHSATGVLYNFTITPAWNGSQMTLTWPGAGQVLEATNLPGPWTTNASATSPLIITPNGDSKFFRVMAP